MPTAWFVDGAYAIESWSKLQTRQKMDYIKLRARIERDAGESVSDAYFFNSTKHEDNQPRDGFHNILERAFPDGAGMNVKLYWLNKKPLYWPAKMGGLAVLHPDTKEQFISTAQKAVDVALASYLIRSYMDWKWDKLYLFAGDGDFYEPLRFLVEEKGVQLKIIGLEGSISGRLQTLTDHIIELPYIQDSISLVRD